MKNIHLIIVSGMLAFAVISCGGNSNSVESKIAKLEELKSKQASLQDEIQKLEDELAQTKDSTKTDDSRTKFVAVTSVIMQPFVHAIDVQGRVDGDENITYSSKVPSVVTRINIKVGQQIAAGQILAELDAKAVKAQLEALKKQFELANSVYEKRKTLWEQNVGSEIEFLKAKSDKESLEKSIEATKESIDMYYIKSEYAGTVDEVKIKIGQNVSPGIPCITVVNPNKLKVKANLSESYSGLVKNGNRVNLVFPDIEKSIKAEVSHTSRTIDQMTRTFEVDVNLPADNELNPNMIAQLSIVDYEKPSAIVIPINTIQQIDGQSIVFLASTKDGKTYAKKVLVKVGKQYNGKAEILDGIQVNDRLITVGFQDLNDGQEIKL